MEYERRPRRRNHDPSNEHTEQTLEMLEFKIGDRVTFQSDRTQTVEGTLVRYNKKTVTVIADDGRRWSVSPGLLRNAATPNAKADVKNVTPRRLAIPGVITDE